jgi:hypothetical protein
VEKFESHPHHTADRDRYKREVEAWNTVNPDEQLVIGKRGFAHRKTKSKVDEAQMQARQLKRAEASRKRTERCVA